VSPDRRMRHMLPMRRVRHATDRPETMGYGFATGGVRDPGPSGGRVASAAVVTVKESPR